MSLLLKITDVDLNNKTVLVRVDYNVPVVDGKVRDDTRIVASLPTIEEICQRENVRLALVSHLGRPAGTGYDKDFSLQPVAQRLSELLGSPIPLQRDWTEGIDFSQSNIVLCENVRFQPGEEENDDDLARKLAGLCDVYVNDAFATCHRAHVSTCGIAKYANISCAGLLLIRELKNLTRILQQPDRPLVAIVGGAKMIDKSGILHSILAKVDTLILGGGVANTFLHAQGHILGNSLYEADFAAEARAILQQAKTENCTVMLPPDVVCAPHPEQQDNACVRSVDAVTANDMILDIGSESVRQIATVLADAGTILWSGPMGMFEQPAFAVGTGGIAAAVAKSNAFSVIGGGDTIAAVRQAGVSDAISYISTGGGAFLEFVEGKTLPGLAILDESARVWEAMERARDM